MLARVVSALPLDDWAHSMGQARNRHKRVDRTEDVSFVCLLSKFVPKFGLANGRMNMWRLRYSGRFLCELGRLLLFVSVD